jgi:UDP-glucose 4-epimerase
MKGEHLVANTYQGKRVLVTGGLGFIGSNLARTLAAHGAHVRVVDALVPGCGGSLQNLGDATGDISVIVADIADTAAVTTPLRDCHVVFNLASEISHVPSTANADRDLALNVSSQLSFLGLCAKEIPGARVVYTCTRQVYGVARYLPVDEAHPMQPVDFNGVHKMAAAHYHLLLSRMQQLDAVVLYLTNVYGPRIALHLPHQGFLATFLSRALAGKPVEVFGDGSQKRDPIYVDDAVEAILRAGALPLGEHRSFNIGHPDSWTLYEVASRLSCLAGLREPRLTPFPPDRKLIDVGDYLTDIRLAQSVLGWRASTSLLEGLAASMRFYGVNLPAGELSAATKGQEHVA